MPNPSGGAIIPSGNGMLQDIALRLKLVGRLMFDSRVSPLLKLLPLASAVYLLFPDLVPGPIDDAAIIWGALYFFIEWAPAEVVEEHVRSMLPPGQRPTDEPAPGETPAPGEVIEGQFRDE